MSFTETPKTRRRSKTTLDPTSFTPLSLQDDDALPPWDRTFDAVYHKHASGNKPSSAREAHFSTSIDRFFQESGRQRSRQGYFRLPDNVRFLICQYVLAPFHSSRPIRLNKKGFVTTVWRKWDFAPPSIALVPLRHYSNVSFAFRADILLTLLSTSTFHVTFSPFIGPSINPLATTWLSAYGPYMRDIVVEVDLSRLGQAGDPGAARLLSGNHLVEKLVCRFVEAQLSRGADCPLSSLVLLCRRFYGRRRSHPPSVSNPGPHHEGPRCISRESARSTNDARPCASEETRASDRSSQHTRCSSQHTRTGSDYCSLHLPSPLPQTEEYYCPASNLFIFNHFLRLKNRINSLRMCGFTEEYTTRFIASIFPGSVADMAKHAYRVAPSTLWPRLPGQKSYVDRGDGSVILDGHHSVTRARSLSRQVSQWEGCVVLPPPIIANENRVSLPDIVGALHRSRTGTMESSKSAKSLPEQALSLNISPDMVESEKARIKKLLGRYGNRSRRPSQQKRTFSREAAKTL